MIDLAPLFNQVVLPIMGAIAVPIGAWAAKRIADLAHVQMTEKRAQAIEIAIQNGVSYGLSQVQQHVAGKGLTLNVKNEVIDHAVSYVLPKVPDTLKKLGITPAGLSERIEARLHDRVS